MALKMNAKAILESDDKMQKIILEKSRSDRQVKQINKIDENRKLLNVSFNKLRKLTKIFCQESNRKKDIENYKKIRNEIEKQEQNKELQNFLIRIKQFRYIDKRDRVIDYMNIVIKESLIVKEKYLKLIKQIIEMEKILNSTSGDNEGGSNKIIELKRTLNNSMDIFKNMMIQADKNIKENRENLKKVIEKEIEILKEITKEIERLNTRNLLDKIFDNATNARQKYLEKIENEIKELNKLEYNFEKPIIQNYNKQVINENKEIMEKAEIREQKEREQAYSSKKKIADISKVLKNKQEQNMSNDRNNEPDRTPPRGRGVR